MLIPILLPALSPTMESGKLVKWLKKEGDKVNPGDIIVDVETDKAVMEYETADSGILRKIVLSAGAEDIKVGALIGVISTSSKTESEKEINDFIKGIRSNDDISEKSSKQETPTMPSNKQENEIPEKDINNSSIEPKNQKNDNDNYKTCSDRIFISPLARSIARNANIEDSLSQIEGSGPNGRIVKEDVEKYIASASSAIGTMYNANNTVRDGASTKDSTLTPISSMRKTIATRMTESKSSVPHFYLKSKFDAGAALKFRKDINVALADGTADGDVKRISINDMLIKACGLAIRDNPNINAYWTNDGILSLKDVDISVAVSLDDGLITPVLRGVSEKSLTTVSAEMKKLANKARSTGLRPEEFSGGGMTISNLGMMNIEEFYAIINTPQSCILAVGAIKKSPAISSDGNIIVRDEMTCILSADHRILDGASASQFLNTIKKYFENPLLLS